MSEGKISCEAEGEEWLVKHYKYEKFDFWRVALSLLILDYSLYVFMQSIGTVGISVSLFTESPITNRMSIHQRTKVYRRTKGLR